jgi:hypothetical protein
MLLSCSIRKLKNDRNIHKILAYNSTVDLDRIS